MTMRLLAEIGLILVNCSTDISESRSQEWHPISTICEGLLPELEAAVRLRDFEGDRGAGHGRVFALAPSAC